MFPEQLFAGCMNQFFTLDWRPLAFADSFGHDVEICYLLSETDRAWGPEPEKTWRAAGSFTDHASRRLGREVGRVRGGGEQSGPGEDRAGEDIVARPRVSTRCYAERHRSPAVDGPLIAGLDPGSNDLSEPDTLASKTPAVMAAR